MQRIVIGDVTKLQDAVKWATEHNLRAQFAEGLLRLFELQVALMAGETGAGSNFATGHIASDWAEHSFAWWVQSTNGHPDGRARTVMNGGLIYDATTRIWGIHT